MNHPYGCWKLNSGLLGKKYMLLNVQSYVLHMVMSLPNFTLKLKFKNFNLHLGNIHCFTDNLFQTYYKSDPKAIIIKANIHSSSYYATHVLEGLSYKTWSNENVLMRVFISSASRGDGYGSFPETQSSKASVRRLWYRQSKNSHSRDRQRQEWTGEEVLLEGYACICVAAEALWSSSVDAERQFQKFSGSKSSKNW